MQFPFKDLPAIRVEPKNCTVFKVDGATGEVIKPLLVGLTKTEAVSVAIAANRFNARKQVRTCFKVKEETNGR